MWDEKYKVFISMCDKAEDIQNLFERKGRLSSR